MGMAANRIVKQGHLQLREFVLVVGVFRTAWVFGMHCGRQPVELMRLFFPN